ncbi:translesion DNA synthesis-associated protein ImuA [Natronospira bacteriovora]|uniref:Translesion DNA synthesis-associated protein ImuA n=1 Tax=Natronospira bacteriovora TaxID=3069753 RepID=A0ABU0W4I9_9GAMM|nr:translesion DNA synthesis-associated protein ImuA [Natronospira sp. AB-CW4]MDQ2068882.1 translesion DNA synthesis-associated protein ImuA [Natronospira sp. AB-CW4]
MSGLDELLRDPRVFRPRRGGASLTPSQATGFAALDALLPGGGWPRGALVELLGDEQGIGELRLLLPALCECQRQGQWLLWVSPPYLPYAPALRAHGLAPHRCVITRPEGVEEQVWTLEQGLRSGACGAVLGWPRQLSGRHVRRLQLAAESTRSLAFLFRPGAMAIQRSPAALRLALSGQPEGLGVELIKSRGAAVGQRISLPL